MRQAKQHNYAQIDARRVVITRTLAEWHDELSTLSYHDALHLGAYLRDYMPSLFIRVHVEETMASFFMFYDGEDGNRTQGRYNAGAIQRSMIIPYAHERGLREHRRDTCNDALQWRKNRAERRTARCGGNVDIAQELDELREDRWYAAFDHYINGEYIDDAVSFAFIRITALYRVLLRPIAEKRLFLLYYACTHIRVKATLNAPR